MREYRININSNWRAIACFILVMPFYLFSLDFIPSSTTFIQIITFAILLLTMYVICDLVSRGTIRISVTSSGVKTVWTRQFLLAKNPDTDLSWDRIVDFKHHEDKWLESFKLTLTENQQYKFYKYTLLPQQDNFHSFIKEFPNLVNNTNKDLTKKIREGESEYLNSSFQWALILMTIAGIFLLVYKFIDPNSGPRWSALGTIFFGIIYYWYNVYIEKTNANNL